MRKNSQYLKKRFELQTDDVLYFLGSTFHGVNVSNLMLFAECAK